MQWVEFGILALMVVFAVRGMVGFVSDSWASSRRRGKRSRKVRRA